MLGHLLLIHAGPTIFALDPAKLGHSSDQDPAKQSGDTEPYLWARNLTDATLDSVKPAATDRGTVAQPAVPRRTESS